MAEIKRLRVSKACDSCRRKKVKCDAVHPFCTNCQAFKQECTYNDPTKKRGPPKGYIEAIEARLHRMEGLLGGLIKDKDPRAEIVKAELDAMAREAEMTGLKLRRSKAYEEITDAMITHLNVDASSSDQGSAQSDTPMLDVSTTQNYSTHVNSSEYPQDSYKGSYYPPLLSSGNPSQTASSSPHLRPLSPYQNRHPQSSATSPDFNFGSPRFPDQGYSYTGTSRHPSHNIYERSHAKPIGSHSMQKHYQYQNTQGHESYHPIHGYTYQSTSRVDKTGRDIGFDFNSTSNEIDSGSNTSWDHKTLYKSKNHEGYHQYDSVVPPSPSVIDHLLGIYFQFVHPVLPMLHKQTIYDHAKTIDTEPSHLFFAVLGISSRFSESPVFRTPQPDSERPPSTLFYEKAKHLIKEEYDNSQLGTVQALLLMSIQQMGFCENQKAWLTVGMAIRMAQDLGLNNELSDQEQSRNRQVAELRKRTWWSCYVVERLVCAGLGRPLTITQQDCEVGFPQLDIDGNDKPLGMAGSSESSHISNFVHLINLSKIQGEILQFTKSRAVQCEELSDGYPSSPNIGSNTGYRYRVDISQEAFFALDRSLTEWRQNLPESLGNPTEQAPHFSLFLHLTYNSLMILLHRPEYSNSATSASLCNQAAATITDIAEMLMKANALTAMFVSCLYSIFSAGIIHFMNIPSARNTRTPAPLTSTNSAKNDVKRCIDALKHLSSHWISAARRAKVLEDLLDLKHVSLNDIEEDSFSASSLIPPWAYDNSLYSQTFNAPRDSHDRLRQQCRSKIMAIQSLLGTDEEPRASNFDKELKTMTASFGEHHTSTDQYRGLNIIEPQLVAKESIKTTDNARYPGTNSTAQTQTVESMPKVQYDTDPMMLISTVTFGTPDSHARSTGIEYGRGRSTLPLKLNTMMLQNGRETRQAVTHQESMFDPFSMPSSITFPSQNHNRQASCSGNSHCLGPQSNTVWSMDAQTRRTIARSEPLTAGKGCGTSVCKREESFKFSDTNQVSFNNESVGKDDEYEDMDLVWNDMPPTLGLDEWMAYIGALMMRWLASGESSPKSE